VKKLLIILVSSFLFLSCAEDSTEDSEDSSTTEEEISSVSLSSQSISINSNIGSIKYLVKTSTGSSSSNSLISSSLSSDISTGYVYALNTNDQLIPIFNPFSTGHLDDIDVSGDKKLYAGEFTVSSVSASSLITKATNESICILIYESGDSSTCLVEKQDSVDSVRAVFYKETALIFISVDGKDEKELYEYDLISDFKRVSSFKSNGSCDAKFDCFGDATSDYEFSGDVVDSYSTGDIASFLVSDGTNKEMATLSKVDGDYRLKVDVVSSKSVISINGDPIYMSEGKLRQGWAKSVYYNKRSNNRSISNESMLVDKKEGGFSFFYQNNYTHRSFNIPSVFYLKPRRSDLPISYPDFTLDRINCCLAKKVDGALTGGSIQEIAWTKSSGYKEYVLAYGDTVSSDYSGYSELRVNIGKAIILIDGKDSTTDGHGNLEMKEVVLYDFGDTSANMDNLIIPLSFDTVTNITNYVNGFKLEGSVNSNSKTLYYNPSTNNIETPNTNDQQSFTIKERL